LLDRFKPRLLGRGRALDVAMQGSRQYLEIKDIPSPENPKGSSTFKCVNPSWKKGF
jgi:hypothetical protein